ncbi:Crp/Fnr family transcriptional regulator [Aequorivita marina]|uniref:Crp/Fnr family transcriptional regulator n=1 Tax=Aequorivita marina TaxID=3073654 RepID=UPI00287622B3|nr:Crp/Fnr family transcriptional regulator [Aequorivita sp. S2608]MDS1297467.1 Crp/Fnr family transcriptional regulator [Aequorivita sp. S2608]
MAVEPKLVKTIFKDLSFTTTENELLAHSFKRLELSKHNLLLEAGQQVNDQYFVASGCLRTYYIDPDGKEHTVQFAVEDWWISDYTAFFNSSQAAMHIECIQDSTLFKITKNEMEALYLAMPKLESYFRKKMERAFSSFQKRIISNLAQSASERYLNFIHTYPNIEQSVKNYHIASYLGITTQSLSRIRKELAQG